MIARREFIEKVCCCGHGRLRHHPDYGFCMSCGGDGCVKFHEVGEGHGYAFEVFVAFAIVLVFWGAWAVWRVHERVTGVGTKYSAPLTYDAMSLIIIPANAATSANG